ncbi:MAG: membrane integrity-associated transporter subunit PqiC [Gammaproteobacteria bacterium]|nr:membrane integrity-associated transporter subunit PqiC [Gammaproteobacteria bacterium]
MTRAVAARRVLWCIAGAIGLGACSHSLLRSDRPPPTVYALAPHPGTPAPRIAADLKVLAPIVAPGIGSARIAASFPDRRLDHFARVRWSAPLAEAIEQLAIGEFRARSGLRAMVPDRSVDPTRYWLEIEVVAFQADYSRHGGPPTVDAHFVARVGDAATGRVIARVDAVARRRAVANRMTSIVAAFESAADAALDRIVATTDARLARALTARRRP